MKFNSVALSPSTLVFGLSPHPDIACEIGDAIVSAGDELTRTVSSGIRALTLVMSEEKLKLGKNERRSLENAKANLDDIFRNPGKKVEEALPEYAEKISKLRVNDYLDV